MNQDIIVLLKKYAGNNCTPEEMEQVRHILRSGQYEEEWSVIIQEEANEDPEITGAGFDAERLFKRINSTIEPRKKIIPYQWAAGIAAALLISLSIGYLSLNKDLFKTDPVYFARQITKAGEQKIITLTDGSRIILNNASKLTYPSVFSRNKREVYLSGEAFFDVKHDSSRPFLVHASHLKVQVLGTSFNIKSYQADHHTTVSVATGKVGVNSNRPSDTYMLLP
ncbi:MAG TPA: FecR family protein, partial [Pedobacter sp.]